LIITSQEVRQLRRGEILAQRLGIPCLAADGLHEHVRKPAKSLQKISFERSVKEIFYLSDELVFVKKPLIRYMPASTGRYFFT